MFVCLLACLLVFYLFFVVVVVVVVVHFTFFIAVLFFVLFLIRLFTVPYFFSKIIEIERFALLAAILDECQNCIGGGGCPLSSFDTHPS